MLWRKCLHMPDAKMHRGRIERLDAPFPWQWLTPIYVRDLVRAVHECFRSTGHPVPA